MIEQFAGVRRLAVSEFRALNHTRKPMLAVSLVIATLAQDTGGEVWANFAIGTLAP